MRSFFFILLAFLSLSGLQGQSVDIGKLSGLRMRNIGPAGMSGRVTAIDAVVSNPDIIYIGAASGGVWKSINGGISWTPVFDDQPIQSIGAIAINQRSPDVVWVGTGEGNPRNSQNTGLGVFRTLDGGKTWQHLGLEKTRTIHRLLLHPDNPDIAYAGAQGSPFGPNSERGVYRTNNGGASWERVLYVNDSTGVADLIMDPTNPNKLIAAMWEYGRKPWTFQSGGPGSGLYVTYDGGKTWEKRTDKDGLPAGYLGRIGLAIAPSRPNIVYALVEATENALYKSVDGGRTWKMATDRNVSNRPFYYHEIYVDPQNENRLFNLYSGLSVSEDGGRTFENLRSDIHPDHHAFWIHPERPQLMMNGNDGGFNISRDGGQTWQFADNLPLGQFYHLNVDLDIPYNIGGGLQDNGSWVGPAYLWENGGIRNSHWQEVFFGDGFDVSFRPDNNRYVYAMSQGGNLGMVDRQTGRSRSIRPTGPKGVELRFNWNAGFAQSPFDPCTIYYGSQFLHKSTDCGESWTLISPDLTTNDSTKQQQNKSGGLTIDNTAAENHTTILAVAPSPVNAQVIWVGTDDGNLQLTRDGGQTWTNLASRLPGAKAGSWIPQIEVSAKNAAEAFVIVNDYRRNDWRPMLFHTADYGQTWRNLVADSKVVSGPALSVVQDQVEPSLLFLGTDHGLFFSIDAGRNWTKWTKGYPSVPTADMKIHPREHDLVIATFGRSFWVLDDIRPLRELARTQGKILDEAFVVFDAPDAYLAEFRSFHGYHFPADGIYNAENRSDGAQITAWVHPNPGAKPVVAQPEVKKEEKAKKKDAKAVIPAPATSAAPVATNTPARRPERIKVQVINAAGDTIRTFTQQADTGFVRLNWNLRRDGVRLPSRRPERPNADPPAGPEVLPGAYKLVISYGKYRDSTQLTVHNDPRLPASAADLQAKDAAYNEFAALGKRAAAGYERLQDARKAIGLVNDAIVNAADSTKKAITTHGKELIKKIEALEKEYMMPDGLKGIQRSTDNLSGTLGRTASYINALDGQPNQAVKVMMEQAREETAEVLKKVNAFINGDFAEYQRKVEGSSFSLFKKMEEVR